MLPIGDENAGRRRLPYITFLLILANVIVFFVELAYGDDFILRWSFTPVYFWTIPAASLLPSSAPCSCMPAGFILLATCCISLSSAIT